MFLQSKNDHVVLLGSLGVLLLCLMQGVPRVGARFAFELDLQSSSTTGSCDIIDLSPGCETYFRFCLRRSTSEQSRNIDDCPLGSHGRVDENDLPFNVSISSDSVWLGSFQLYIKALDDDSPFPSQDLDFIFINNMLQPLQGYSNLTTVTGDDGRVTVTLRYRVRCQNGYYRQDCNSVCGANQQCYSNGTRECVSGWQSPDTSCNTPICRTGCHPIGGSCSAPFQCECNEGWRGDLCDQCIPATGCSEVGGFCEVPEQCLCNEGFRPPGVCNEPICRTGCHPIGGNCSAPFQCECNEGWRGDLCDQCIPAAGCSEVGGFCEVPGQCLCREGFGPPGVCNELTSAASNACMSSPCANGSTCTPDPDSGSYTCHCLPGYTGPNCDTNIDECMEASCPENSTCEDGVNTFRCVCDIGYGGPNCTETASNGQAPSSAVNAGIIVGCLVVLLIILSVCVILLLFLVIRKRRHNKLTNSASPSESANFYSNTAGSNSPKSYEVTPAVTTPTSDDGNHLEALVTNPLYGDPTSPTQLSDSAVISTNAPQTSLSPSTLHKLDNPLYGDPTEKPTDIYSDPTNPTQLSDSAVISTNAPQTSLSPSTLHKLDNPLYGDPTEKPTDIYSDPTNPTQLSDSAVISTNAPQTSLSPSTLHKVDNPLYGDPTEKPTDIYSEPTIIQYGGSDNQTEPYAYTRMEDKGSCHGNTGTQNVNQYNYTTTAGDTSPSSTAPYHPYNTLQYVKETPPPVKMSKREGAGYEALQN